MPEYSLGTAALGTEVDLDGLKKGLDDAEKVSAEKTSKLGGIVSGAMTTALAGIGIAVGVAIAGAGAAVVDMAGNANQATNSIQAQLGTTRDEASALRDAALGVFGNNFGQSVEDATQSLIEVRKQIRGIADEDLQGATEKAIALRDAFGVDVAESTNAVNTLMHNFGLTSDQAFDFVTAGMQRGLNASGDFLDSIGEYSVQFAEGGATAEEMFSAMETGIQGGVLGTDKILDAFKESRIRIMELSDDLVGPDGLMRDVGDALATSLELPPEAIDNVRNDADAVAQALEEIGLKVDKEKLTEPLMVFDEELGRNVERVQSFGDIVTDAIAEGLKDGSVDIAQAQDLAIRGLREMDDEVARNAAGVAIFGTQWEDVGAEALLAVDTTKTSLDDLSGSTDGLTVQYDNFGSMFESVKRRALLALMPLGQAMLDLGNRIMPHVLAAFAWLEEQLPGWIDQAVVVFNVLKANIVPIFAGLAAAVLTVVVPAFIGWATTAGAAAIATITALAPVVLPIVAIGAAVGLLAKAWETDFGGIRTTITTWWNGTGKPIFEQLKQWLAQTLTEALQTLSDFWTDTLQPALQVVWEFIQDDVIPLLEDLVRQTFADVQRGIQKLSDFWTDTLQPALQAVWKFIDQTLVPAFQTALAGAIETARNTADALVTFWNETLKPAFDAIDRFIQETLKPAFETALSGAVDTAKGTFQTIVNVWNDTLKPALDAIKRKIDDTAKPAFDALTRVANGVKNAINGIKNAIDTVLGFLDRLANKINSLPGLPNDYKQESPSPVEQSFLDIGAAASRVTASLSPMARAISGLAGPRFGELARVASSATADVRVTFDERGVGVLRDLIRVEVERQTESIGSRGDIRRRT